MMAERVIFVILLAGLGVGMLIARRVAKADVLSGFLWMSAGAIPGISLLVGEKSYMLALLACGALLWWRHWSIRKNKAVSS